MAWREARASRGTCAITAAAMALSIASTQATREIAKGLATHTAENVRQWIASDAMVQLGQPPSEEEWAAIRRRNSAAESTVVIELPAMAESDASPDPVAVAVKAVDPEKYPFYGNFTLTSGQKLRLDAESAVVSRELAELLHGEGAKFRIKHARFEIRGVIESEPDAFAGPYSPAPRVVISEEGLARTGLLRFSDSACYRVLFKLPPNAGTRELCRDLAKLYPDAAVSDYTTPVPLMTISVDWLSPFLNIVALLSLGFGACSIAVVTYLHVLRNLDMIAILKSLGGTSRWISSIYGFQIFGFSLLGIVAGLPASRLVSLACVRILARQTGIHLSLDGTMRTAIESAAAGIVAALIAAVFPLYTVRHAGPGKLLRRDVGEREAALGEIVRGARPGAGVVAALSLSAPLLYSMSRLTAQWMLLLWGAAALAALGIVIRLMLAGLRSAIRLDVRHQLPFALRYGLSSLHRHRRETGAVLSILAISAGLYMIARVGQRRGADRFVEAMPFGSPNLLFFNVGASDAAALREILRNEPSVRSPVALLPTTWLVLRSAGGRSLEQLHQQAGPSWVPSTWPATCSDVVPRSVKIVSGKWWDSSTDGVSVALDDQAAGAVGVGVGDFVEFAQSGASVRARVSSIVRVPPPQRFWFGVTLSCSAFSTLRVSTYTGGVSVDPSHIADLQRALQDKAQTATIVDANQLRRRVEATSAETAGIVDLIAIMLACTGAALLWTVTIALRPFRQREVAILRALGASRRRMLSSLLTEHFALGAMGGALGGSLGCWAAALLLNYLIGTPGWTLDGAGVMGVIAASSVVGAGAGLSGSLVLLRKPPAEVLRRR